MMQMITKLKKRIATLKVVEELSKMEIGEIVQFPLCKYNYATVRSTPSGRLANEQCEGAKWKTRLNRAEKCVDVIRVS